MNARLVGLDPAGVPADTAGLAAYFDRIRPELAAGPDALAVDDFLRGPPVHPSSYVAETCCGRTSRVWHTVPSPAGRTVCTVAPHRTRAASPGACASPASCCAAFPQVYAGSCLQVTS